MTELRFAQIKRLSESAAVEIIEAIRDKEFIATTLLNTIDMVRWKLFKNSNTNLIGFRRATLLEGGYLQAWREV